MVTFESNMALRHPSKVLASWSMLASISESLSRRSPSTSLGIMMLNVLVPCLNLHYYRGIPLVADWAPLRPIADIPGRSMHVRFTPDSRHPSAILRCPLSADCVEKLYSCDA